MDNLGIKVVPLYYDLGHGQLRESDAEGDFSKFYADLVAAEGLATTSPPTVDDFLAVYRPLLESYDSIVSIHISSAISETYSNASDAVEMLKSEGQGGERVVVIDSAGATGHLGFQALAAARAAAAGEDAAGVVERARQARQEVRLWFLVDTLEYLRRGGRIGGAAAWIGSALDIKPILTVESEIMAVERVRTRKRGIERLVELMRQRRSLGADRWFVQHAAAHHDAQLLVDRLTDIFARPPEFVAEVGPVVGTHVGPGTLWAGGLPGSSLR